MQRRDVVIIRAVDEGVEVRHWISFKDAETVPAQQGRGNDVACDRRASAWILKLDNLSENVRGRIGQQFTEIALAHLERRHGPVGAVSESVPHPFLSPVPEELTLVPVEPVGNVEGSADV